MTKSRTYSVTQLAKLAGLTVKTLHLYDKNGLLKPAERTDSRYRRYGEKEFLRLQQILFYKELDFPLKAIHSILDDPNFETLKALEGHKQMLKARKSRLNTMMKTLESTINSIKTNTMINPEDLYHGLSREEAQNYRNEAISNYGEEVVVNAESHLKTVSKEELQQLVTRQKELGRELYLLKDLAPEAGQVQKLIDQHYLNTRQLWGTHQIMDQQAEAYSGLGQLYLTDERFTNEYGMSNQDFRVFISKAMTYYADKNLR